MRDSCKGCGRGSDEGTYLGHIIHIGKVIREEMRRQKRGATYMAEELNTSRSNVNDIFTRQSIDTALLFRICRVLGVDVFKMLSEELREGEGTKGKEKEEKGKKG